MVIPFIVGFTVIPCYTPIVNPFFSVNPPCSPQKSGHFHHVGQVSKKQGDDLRQLSAELEIRMVKATPLGGWGGKGRFPVRGRYAPFCSLFWDVLGNFHCIIVSPKKVEHSQILLQWWFREIYTCLHFVGEGIAHIVGSLVISWLNNPI